MFRYLILSVLVLGALAVGIIGCGPRAQVARNKVLEKIDSVLGELNVKQQQVENAYAELRNANDEIREKRIEAQVRVKQKQEEINQLEEKQAKLAKALKNAKPKMEAAKESGFYETKSGRKISLESLDMAARNDILQLKNIKVEIKDLTGLTDMLGKQYAQLKKTEDVNRDNLKALDSRIKQIKLKKKSLDAYRSTTVFANADASVSDKFDELNADVADLLAEVDTKLQVEAEKLDERMAEVESKTISIDELLEDETDVSGTLNEIDELLGDDSGDSSN